MAEKESDSTYRINGLYVTPNWNGNSDRVAMSCGIGANIKVRRKVSIGGNEVVIAADTAGTMARSWNMTAKNTILRTTAKVYLYARVERNGANGMYIWSPNFYDIDGTVPAVNGEAEPVKAVNNDQYYYIRVGSLETDRTTYEIDEGQYGVSSGGDDIEEVSYTWSDLIAWDRTHDLLVFLKTIAGLAIDYIILKGRELNQVLTSGDSEDESSDNAVVTAGFLQKWVNKIKGMFIRKDVADGTDHPLHAGELIAKRSGADGANGIVRTEQFTATSGAMGGVGAGMWMLEDGTGIMETDLFYVRRAAYFRSLTIAEVKHMGGEVILSAAACQIAYVVPYDMYGQPIPSQPTQSATTPTPTTPTPTAPLVEGELYSPTQPTQPIQPIQPTQQQAPAFYRCYFEKQSGGRKVYNEWMSGDQARCQRFDAEGNEVESSFYWRLVVGVGEDDDFYYVDLSYADCAEYSNPPKSNDNIVLFGHRNPTAATYDRTCAQIYSTVGINAPSRTYYRNITDYDLTKATRIEHLGVVNPATGEVEWVVGDDTHYIKYNTRTGLDIRTSSMIIIADGGDKKVDVGEALGDSWSFFTTEDEARKEGNEYVEWMPAAELVPNEAERWDSSVWKNYLGYQIITPHGITYKLDTNIDEIMWHLNTDRYLIFAQQTADAAIQNLDDMSSDGMISAQEKSTIISNWASTENEHSSILEEAYNNDVDPSAYNEAYLRLEAFVNYFRNHREGTTNFVDEERGVLVVTKGLFGAYAVSYSTTIGQDYVNTYHDYYYSLSILRRDISFAIRRYVAQVDGKPIDEVIDRELTTLKEKYAGIEGSITEFNDLRTAILQKTGGNITGLVMKSEMDAAFSVMYAENESSRAEIYAYVDKSVSGISFSADKIDFKSADITMFSNNFRIDADNFKVTDKGVYINGEVHATSGTFTGRVSAAEGFDMGYALLNVADHASEWQVPPGSTLTIVRFDYADNNTVQLPADPHPGQLVKVFALEKYGRTGTYLRVACRSNQKIFFPGSANGDGNGVALVEQSKIAEFVYMDKLALTQDGNWVEPSASGGVWIYLSES